MGYSDVGLGFAEFVAQLLRETFEATLSAQNHQIEKYREMTGALNLPAGRFAENYIDENEILEREADIFGQTLSNGMQVSTELQNIIEETFTNSANLIEKKRLTSLGLQQAKDYALARLVEDKKALLHELLNKTELTRIMVDSGEIRAKLELSNIAEDTQAVSVNSVTTRNSGGRKALKITGAGKAGISASLKGVQMKEILDPASKARTLIIDRSSLGEKLDINSLLPSVRLVAKPVNQSSNGTLFSEVVIKFRSV